MRVVILGDGGHSVPISECFHGWVIRPWDHMPDPDDRLVFGMGSSDKKKQLIEMHGAERFIPAVHRSAIIAGHVQLGLAVQIMAGVIVQNFVDIRNFVLINTGAIVEHDCRIGEYCHIAPGAVLCGNVALGNECLIGANATIVEGVTLAAGTKIPAGSLVVGQDDIRRPSRMV